MKAEQFEDKNLSHYSYAILNEQTAEIVLIDPARNPQPYLDFALANNAQIIAVIETHPHADFVSSHLEISQLTGAEIYVSKLVKAFYPHSGFDEGGAITIGNIKLSALNTPGHSPDSICILLEEDGIQKMVFTGDTLFIGDCGRPDLREGVGNIQVSRNELAKQMYHSLRDKLVALDGDVLVYPAHGAGTLCGKALGKANSSTIRAEKFSNWSLQVQTEADFVQELLADQPFVPAYFPFDVALNRKGAAPFKESVGKVGRIPQDKINAGTVVVDARKAADFRKGHLPKAVNIIEGGKFETWLGSIVKPREQFCLAVYDEEQGRRLVERSAAIGYERQVQGIVVLQEGPVKEREIALTDFKSHSNEYTIVDVRNEPEVKEGKKFEGSIAIPLGELRERVNELPTDKPIVVHCAGGTRSATGSSIIKAQLNGNAEVFDLGEAIKEF